MSAGSRTTAKIDAGQVDCYSIALVSGQVVRASLLQKGTDLWASVRSSEGNEEIFDTRWHGEESFALSSQNPAKYEIRIGIRPDSPFSGEYVLDLRLPESPDREIGANRARRLFTKVKERLKNPDRAALAAAASDAEAALSLWRAAQDPIGEAQAINAVGYLRHYSGDREGAMAFYEKALDIWTRIGDLTGQGETRQNMAMSLNALGRRSEALEQASLALDLRKRSGDRAGEGITLGNLASLEYQSGRFAEAIERCKEALAILEAARMIAQQLPVLSNLAVCYHGTGRYREALEVYRRAIPLSTVADRRGYGYLLNNLGRLQDDLGDFGEALRYFLQARDEARRVGDPVLEAASLNNISSVYLARGDKKEATKANEATLALPATPVLQIKFLLTKARISESKGDLDLAASTARSCLEKGRTLEDAPIQASALLVLSRIAARRKEHAAAITFNTEAVDLWRQALDRNNEAFALIALANAKRAAGRKDDALRDAASAVELLDSIRTTVSAQELRGSLISSRYQHFKLWIDLLMETGHPREALAASEHARARVLLDLLGEERHGIRAGADRSDLAKIDRLTAEINGKTFLMGQIPAGKGSAARRSAAGKEIDGLLAARRDLEKDLRVKSPRYASLTDAKTVTASEIQSLLDPRTALIEYSLDRDRGYAWVVTKTSLRAVKLRGAPAIAQAVKSLGDVLLDVQADSGPSAKRLSDLVLSPIRLPARIRRLAIVAEGPLESVPFAALPALDGRPLLASFEVVRLPSASVLAALRRQRGDPLPVQPNVFVVADPVFDKEDPRAAVASNVATQRGTGQDTFARLFFSGEEARTIAAEAGPKHAKLFDGFNARREVLFVPEARNYRIHHLATHLVLDDRRPELSGIVFSLLDDKRRPIDGFLRLHEIYDLDLPSDLVVLSACKSGLGFPLNGEGLVGFTRGMLLAGARAVAVSVWPIDDQATAELMKRFYHELLRNSLASLRNGRGSCRPLPASIPRS